MLTADDQPRLPYKTYHDWYASQDTAHLIRKTQDAENIFRKTGITFAVYGEGGDPDRLIPFDMFPRVFSGQEWSRLEKGIKQRARALNAFLADVYSRGEIIKAGRIPARLVYLNEAYEKAVAGIRPPKGVFSHIVGIDLVEVAPDYDPTGSTSTLAAQVLMNTIGRVLHHRKT